MSETPWVGLRLDPLDTLFCRDGRPFGAATRAEGGLPLPQTLAGSLRSALLTTQRFDFAALAQRRRRGQPIEQALAELNAPRWITQAHFRGPWLAEVQGDEVQPLVPLPRILARDEQRWFRSAPLPPEQLPGWPAGSRWPLWRSGGAEAKNPGGFLTQAGLRIFLEGGVPAAREWRAAGELFGFEERAGIAVDPGTLTAAEGQLYTIRHLVLRPAISLYAEMQPGPGAPAPLDFQGAFPLGGEGRHVRVRTLPQACVWPAVVGEGSKSLWLLATPLPVRDPHQVEGLEPAWVVAAATGTSLAFSGWDIARNGPRPARFAVPAGSVYFVEGALQSPGGSLVRDPELLAQGWGMALRGIWNHA